MLLRLQVSAANRPQLRVALAGLTAMDLAYVPELPPLYEAGVRYRREAPDTWSTADIVYARGFGDCEDLAAWRAAELRITGEDPAATADLYEVAPRKWHAIVLRGDGTIEDPSKVLGMRTRRRRGVW